MKLEESQAFAEAVDDRLLGLLRDQREGEGLLGMASRHLCLAPGARRLRPRLVFGVGQLLGVPGHRLIDLAAAVEAIHGASLLHDDVVDAGTTRRGLPTANARFGNDVAVLAGDFTLARALGILGRYPPLLLERAIALIEEMTRGAILEIELRGRAELKLPDWRKIAEGKSGALFGFGAMAAAVVGGRPELKEPLDAFGRKLGIAFQMADDLRDVLDDNLGKDRYADLKNRNPSSVLASLPPKVEEALRALWSRVLVSDAQAAEFAAKLSQAGVLSQMLKALDDELHGVVQVWTEGAGLPEAVAEEICRVIRGQLGRREDA